MHRKFICILILIAFASLCERSQAGDSWWQFRGPKGDGNADSSDLVMRWDESKNVAWKTPVHDRGWSSPVISGDKVWMTTATRSGHQLFAICVDKNNGRLIHDLHLFDVDSPQKITEENTYATPSPVVFGNKVLLHFGTYGTACLDVETGKELWRRRDLNCDHEANAGPASSPTMIDGNFVVHVDGRDFQYIIALSPETGQTVWKTERSRDFTDVPVNQRKAFCMPIVFGSGKDRQIVSPGGRAIYAYDLDGNERWRVEHRGFSVAPRPVFGFGMVFSLIDRDNPELWAIRTDGTGDVTQSHVVWKEFRSMPQRCSPLLIDDLLYLVNREGIATCLEAKTGGLVWRERLSGRFSASPIYANNRIYYFNEDAEASIIRPGRDFELLQTNSLSRQRLLASPAVDGDSLIVRTESYVYRIEKGKKQANPPPATAQEFVGDWEIGRNPKSGKIAFVMSLRSDMTARKSHVPNSTGRWEVVNGEARIVWSEGWRDIIRREGDRYRKIAFEPGKDFDSTSANEESAERKGESGK